jgi:hypothetical protein
MEDNFCFPQCFLLIYVQLLVYYHHVIFITSSHHFSPVSPHYIKSCISISAYRASSLTASKYCGDEDYVTLSVTPWIVYNMLYNADVTVGTQSTNSQNVETPATGNPEVVWSGVVDIEHTEST